MAMTLSLRRLFTVVLLGLAGFPGGCAGSSTDGDGSRHDRGGYIGFAGGLNVGGGKAGDWHY